jgi:hypothetical protein
MTSIVNWLRNLSVDSLLGLGDFDALILLVLVVACIAVICTAFYFATREPVYISATPSQPIWRRRSTQRLGTVSLVALVVVALL